MRRAVLGVIVVVVVASGAWMGAKVFEFWSSLRSTELGIREQRRILETVREDSRKVRDEIGKARMEIEQRADSARADRARLALQRAFDIAKAEASLEQERLRAKERLRHLEEKKRRAARALRTWAIALAATEAFFLGGAAVVHRYRRGKS